MARVTLSPVASRVSGLCGNSVYVTVGGRTYLRSAPQRSASFSSAQIDHQAKYSLCFSLWRYVGDWSQDAWNLFATDLVTSGWNEWVRDNIEHAIGDEQYTLAPVNADVPAPTGVSILKSGTPGKLYVLWDAMPGRTDLKPYVHLLALGGSFWIIPTLGGETMVSGSVAVTGLSPSAYYHVWLSSRQLSDNQLSASVKTFGQAGP